MWHYCGYQLVFSCSNRYPLNGVVVFFPPLSDPSWLRRMATLPESGSARGFFLLKGKVAVQFPVVPPVYPNNVCLHICADVVGEVQTCCTCRKSGGAAQPRSAEVICGQNFTVIPVEEHELINLPAAFWRLNAGWIASFWKINVSLIDENKHMWQLR